MTGVWPVTVAASKVDPYLCATLWLLERPHWAMIAGPEAHASSSVHAKTLRESVLVLDGLHPGPVVRHSGLGIVLAAPTAGQLAGLRRAHFAPSASWFLIPSRDAHERDLQDAWLWAHSRPAPGDADVSGQLLTPAEAWALSLRAGRETPALRPALRRGRLRPIPGGRR